MFESTIKLLEELKEKYKTKNPNIENDLKNEIFNLENFDIFDYIGGLDKTDIIELMITLSEKIQNEEKDNILKQYKNDNGFYNPELKKAQINYEIFEKINNMLIYETY